MKSRIIAAILTSAICLVGLNYLAYTYETVEHFLSILAIVGISTLLAGWAGNIWKE